jgi:hypothetical protein
MPGEEFLAVAAEGDAALADWFGVPIEQVPLRRAELRLQAHGVGLAPCLMRPRAPWVPPSDAAGKSVARVRASNQASNQQCEESR